MESTLKAVWGHVTQVHPVCFFYVMKPFLFLTKCLSFGNKKIVFLCDTVKPLRECQRLFQQPFRRQHIDDK